MNVISVYPDSILPIIIIIIENFIILLCLVPKKTVSPNAVTQSPKFLNTVIMGTGKYFKAKPEVESISTNKQQGGIHFIALYRLILNLIIPNFLKRIINKTTDIC